MPVQPDGRRLDPQRQVLRHDRDVLTVLHEVHRDGEDAGVVVAQAHACRQDRRIRVRELDAQRPAVSDRHREVQAPVLDAQLVEVSQRLSREVPDLRVVALAFELGDHDDGDHDRVLGEPEERTGVAQQHRRVEDVRAQAFVLRDVISGDVVDDGLLVVLCCSSGHNPLPAPGPLPASGESTTGCESRSVWPTRSGTLPDAMNVRRHRAYVGSATPACL
jgi:hypothetical protein